MHDRKKGKMKVTFDMSIINHFISRFSQDQVSGCCPRLSTRQFSLLPITTKDSLTTPQTKQISLENIFKISLEVFVLLMNSLSDEQVQRDVSSLMLMPYFSDSEKRTNVYLDIETCLVSCCTQ